MFFLAVMAIGTGSAWGQTSLGKATMQSSSTTTIGDHDMDVTGAITKALWYTSVEPTNHTTKEEKLFVKLWSDASYIEVRFAKGSVVPNDIVRVEISAFYSGNQTLGYKVDGNSDKVTQNVTDQAIYYIDQTITSQNIKSGDGYDYIRISRNGLSGCAYHSVEIVRPAGNVIKWTSGDIPTGCDAWYTLGDDPTHRKESISGITTGTKVTLTATDAGNAHKIIDYWTFGKSSLYNNAANREMTDWSHAVDGVLNLQPHFCDAYTMTAVAGTGCSSVSLKGTKDANTTEINGIKQKSSATYSLTFTATSESGAEFDGWYNGDSKISGVNPYNYGEYSAGGTTDLSLTAKFKVADSGHPDVTCENGKNKIDLSKISGFGNLTYNYDGNKASVTISQESQYGNGILIKFAKAQDMSHVKTITINGGIQFGDIPFTDGTNNWWPSQNFADGKTIINTNCDSKYTAITEIRLRPGNTTESFEISSIVFEYDHTPATPQFIDGTTAEMTISQGDDITLSVDNSFAFWREYQDANFVWNQQIYDRIPSSEYNTPVRKITGLEKGDYYFAAQVGRNCEFDIWHGSELAKVHVRVTEAFNPALDLNSTVHGSNATMTDGVLTATGNSDNWVKVKDMTGHGNEYSGIRVTTQGKACRIIVRWGEADATQKVTYVDAAEKATTSYYSWSMLGVPENEVANLTSIRFAGASSDFGTTTFSNASLVNVEETTPYARQVGELRDFNLNDTRVQLYGHDAHYQMGGNIQWVYKVEDGGNKFVTMKTTGTSWNQMEIFHSGHYIPTYDGVRVDYQGKHFRVIAYTGDGADDKFVATAPNADNRTARYITWSEFLRGGAIMTENDIRNIKRIEVAGCSEHDAEEAVNFYSIRLHKKSTDVIYTDESTTKGVYNFGTNVLTFGENQDGKDVSVAFANVYAANRDNKGCHGTIIKKNEEGSFTVSAPDCYKVTKVIVGLGEKTTGTGRFNDTENVTVNNQNQITWTNTTEAKSVTMTIPDGAANDNFHITYVYYELEEIAIPSIDVNGKKREYATYVPDGISGQVGVIISLHGASNDYYNGRVDFNAIADEKKNIDGKKFIVVYPRGLLRQLRGQERGWESYTESNTEDVEFFKAVVKELDGKNGLTVDYNRIYLAGFSNGGMMAYKAAHQAADFFAAFASVGGFPVNESHLFHAGSQPTPFIHIQGAADGVFPSATYDLSTIAHNMTYRNGAHFNPYDTGHNSDGGVVPAHANVTREIHVADNGGAAYFLYTIAGMGHTWEYNWDGNAGDDVAQSIWNFFDYTGKVNNIDKTLKFRINDPDELWTIATTEESTKHVRVGYVGLDNVNTGKSVLSYGGRTKTSTNSDTFNKDSNNKNLWHSLQFQGGINGAAHFLKLNVQTNKVVTEDPNEFFLVKLTKTGDATPVFSKRYQAGRGQKDLYINFVALPGFNEYKLEITKSSESLVVMVHGIEAYSGRCEDKSEEENPTAFYDVATVLTGMNPIYQPIFQKSYNGIAKEFLPIAEIPVGVIPEGSTYRPNDIPLKDNEDKDYIYKVINDDLVGNAALTSLPSTVITDWGGATSKTISGTTHGSGATQSYGKLFNIAISGKTGEDTEIKSNNAFIFVPNGQTYTVDKVKGLNISQRGRAMMPEYLNGTRGAFPDRGVIAIKLQGTLDFYLLAQNEVTYTGTDPNPARRTLKVYYTNDQLDGELKELEEWWFYGTRSENGYSNKNGNSLGALSAGVRLPQLGKDGTCTVFITYEGREKGAGPFTHEAEDDNKIWIKGFVIKRPDLKVTIGRTDSKYSSQEYKGENNTKCTRFGENKPYIWSFENVGFNNTRNKDGHRDIDDKKVNEKDGRTYVCGGTDDSVDHLLLYSDGASDNIDDKVQFDGRKLGKEHIEFLKPSAYNIPTATNNRKIYDPIQSNGLKVNVTGSGWFKIMCSAPNGPVNMKVYTQPNYGSSYISLLREFRVEPVADGDLKSGETTETAFREYTVYLKSRGIHTGDNGFWDGTNNDEGKEEIMRQSLFVVFDKIDGAAYTDDNKGLESASPQLNIHQLSWLNEEPADYVFQREEDPKLLTTWQAIRRDGDGNKTLDDSTDDNVVLWWKTGNDDDTEYKKDGVSILKENGKNTYNRLGQYTTNIADGKGVKSPGGYASTSVPSDAGTYDAYWDIAAPASTGSHTEAAYARGNKVIDVSSPQYVKSGANEFSLPISGSFIRICAMKNTYVAAHVIPGAANGDVYVLDETGAPIGFDKNTEYGKRRGYISTMLNVTEDAGEKKSTDGTVRIDFCANAGKEYFICAKDASISLARLEAQDWRYKPAKAASKLEVADNAADNGSKITAAYDAGIPYMDANLRRKVTDKWISLVLPFSMNEKKFEQVFGKGAKCIHFTDVDIPGKTVKLTHHYYNMIVAGRPVFVKPGTSPKVDASNYLKDIEDVTLQTKTVSSYRTPDDKFEFFGSYDNTTMKRNDLFMNNNNAIKFLTDETATYPGMRSFIKNISGPDFYSIIDSSTPAQGKFVNFCDLDDDIVTDIEELITAEYGENVVVIKKSTKVYDLLGNPVADGSRIDSLPAGIYIVNGKKFVVK